MEEKEVKTEETEIKTEETKKKGFPKIILLVLILLLIVGAAFGGTYLGNKYYEKETKKEIKEDEKEKEEEKTEEKKEEPEKTEEKKEIEVSYDKEEFELTTMDKKYTLKNTRSYPTKITIKEDAEKKILDQLKKESDKVWDQDKSELQDQLDSYEKEGLPLYEGIGLSENIKYVASKNSWISFDNEENGWLGGVGIGGVSYYLFNVETGDLLTLDNVCLNVNECKNILFNSYLEQLKKDERFNNIYESNYEAIIKKDIFTDGNWGFTNDGVIFVVPKYEISDGANGAFIYTIPYSIVNSYLHTEYQG